MVPKIHKKGHSFAGVAKYLLHDKDRGDTDGRVAWAVTRNLATQDPQLAWKIMAATALDQDRLKAEAGVKKTGRKSSAHVLHYTLSWHADESADLTRDEMLRAAEQSLAVLGRDAKGANRRQFADEHQSLIVCHDDEPQPHLHVIVNRVHPEHGIMLPSSKDRLALSKWAEGYERERGRIFCQARVFNNAAREKGAYVRGERDLPRPQYELEKQNGHRSDAERIRKEQRAKDRQLSKRGLAFREQRETAWTDLREGFVAGKDALKQRARQAIDRAVAAVRKDFEPEWRKLHTKQRRDLVEFARREQGLLGRVQNAIASIDWREALKSDDRGAVVRDLFERLGNRGTRLEALKQAHLKETRRLQSRQRAAGREATEAVRLQAKKQLNRQRVQFLNRREELILRTEQERTKLGSAWRDRREERTKAWQERVAVRDFNAASRNADPRNRTEGALERNPDPRDRGRDDFGRGRTR